MSTILSTSEVEEEGGSDARGLASLPTPSGQQRAPAEAVPGHEDPGRDVAGAGGHSSSKGILKGLNVGCLLSP